MSRALARFVGLLTLWAGVELLERVAYRAGVGDAAAEVHVALVELRVDEDQGDEQTERRPLCLGDCCRAPA